MLLYPLIHPEILSAIGSAGHGSKILISDSNFPLSTKTKCQRVYLNISPGLVSVTDVLKPILSCVTIERVEVMKPNKKFCDLNSKGEVDIFQEFRNICKSELEQLERETFYDQCQSDDLCISIATGDVRLYANILLTIGVKQTM